MSEVISLGAAVAEYELLVYQYEECVLDTEEEVSLLGRIWALEDGIARSGRPAGMVVIL